MKVGYTAEVVERWAISLQSVACWLDNTYRMGLIPVLGSCLLIQVNVFQSKDKKDLPFCCISLQTLTKMKWK